MTEEIKIAAGREFLDTLLKAPRPAAEKILAFYDSRANLICRDGKCLFIPLDDHLCHRGDGLFESFAWRDCRIFAFREHLERLRKGAAFLRLEPPVSWSRMETLIKAVARAADRTHGDLRLFLGRGGGGFGVSPYECPLTSLYIVALETALPQEKLYREGLRAFTSAVPPKQDYLAGIKNTSYLPNVLMAAEAVERDSDIAISFDSAGNLCEAAIANVAIVDEGGSFRTPALNGILPGTTLLGALDLLKGKMPIVEGPVTREDVGKAREILLFTSATLCVPVTSFDGVPVGPADRAGQPGPVAMWLKDALLKRMISTGVCISDSC